MKIKCSLIRLLVNHRINKIVKVYSDNVKTRLTRSSEQEDKSIITDHLNKWGRLYQGNISDGWIKWYLKVNKTQNPDFVPESIYYSIIEPILNNSEFSCAYSDKNIYDMFYPENLFPETLLRKIEGILYDSSYAKIRFNNDDELYNFLSLEDRFILKPAVESGGGANVLLFAKEKNGTFKTSDGQNLSLKFLKKFSRDFVLQKKLHQHPFTNQFNNSSINTIRILTFHHPYRNDIVILHAILRVGAIGAYVDNSRAGGYSVGINNEGVLNRFAVNKKGEKFTVINGIDLDRNNSVPFFTELRATAINIAKKNVHHRLLGLDMMIDSDNNIRCVEVNNSGNEINFYQLNNGPLFGKFTDDVIDYCIKNKSLLYKTYRL